MKNTSIIDAIAAQYSNHNKQNVRGHRNIIGSYSISKDDINNRGPHAIVDELYRENVAAERRNNRNIRNYVNDAVENDLYDKIRSINTPHVGYSKQYADNYDYVFGQ